MIPVKTHPPAFNTLKHPSQTRRAAIALGSNLGDRENYLRKALALIAELPHTHVVHVSNFIETKPVGGPIGQGLYLNAAAVLSTQGTADNLLEKLLEIETHLGRDRTNGQRYAPRTLDLDLLFYDQDIHESETLTLPHPRMHERRFVLEPLCEIAPDWKHPNLGKTVQQLYSICANHRSNADTFLTHTKALG
jgi:2-amino-4-hydroxy-6-hydroxymethyldihydropteridine diphosphokinase